jgi:hypothetical protein
MNRTTAVIILLTVILAAPDCARADLPIGFEGKGGIGVGYYSMGDLNKSPSDIFNLGGVVNIFKFPKLVDINAGAKGIFAKAIYASNEEDEERFEEYKANDYGWDIFAEVNTNFIKPLEVGLTVGYRNLAVSGFENKFGREPVFSSTGNNVKIDYSGLYFYFTAGVSLW